MKQLVTLTICLLLILFAAEVSPAQEQKPELVVRTGNPYGADSFALSPDGKILATTNASIGSIKLWNRADGAELRTIDWKPTITSLDFSSDGQQIAVGNFYQALKIYDVASGRETKSISDPDSRFPFRDISFSPDDKTIAVSHSNTTVSLWDVKTGRLIKRMGFKDLYIDLVAFSPDGKTIAIANNLRSDFDSNVRLIDAESGKVINTFPVDKDETTSTYPLEVKAFNFNKDGSTLAVVNSDKTVRVLDVKSGIQITRKKYDEHLKDDEYLYDADYDRDGELIVISQFEGRNINLWHDRSQKMISVFKTEVNAIESVAFSRSGKLIASIGKLGTNYSEKPILQLWNVDKGGLSKTINERFSSCEFSPDDKILACLNSKTIKLLDPETGKVIKSLTGNSLLSMKFDSRGDSILTGGYDGSVKLWDIKTEKISLTLKAHSAVQAVRISSDNKFIANSTVEGPFQIWSTETEQLIQTICCGFGEKLEFSADGKLFAHSKQDVVFNQEKGTIENLGDLILIWDIKTGKSVQRLKLNNKLSFQENLATVAGFSSNSTNEIITGAKFSVKRESGNQIDIYTRNSERKEISLISVGENDWLAITPDGFFDGTPNAWKQLIWRFNNDTFNYAPLEAYFNDFFYPGLLQDIMEGKRPAPPAGKVLSKIDRRRPTVVIAPSLQQAKAEASLSTRNVTVSVQVTQNTDKPQDASKLVGGGAQDVRLFRNGSLVKVWRGEVLKGQSSVTLEATIPIVAGENRLTAYAFNHDNIKSTDATLVVNGAETLKRPGTLYVLAVGVNTYSNSNYNLKYAVADAEEFSSEIKRQQVSLKNYERVEAIPLYDKDATKANVLQTLSQLASKAQPEDAVIVYFSGHGTARQQRFYLIPHDLGYGGPRTKLSASDLKSILDHGISDRELESAFEKIDAGQLLMVIDACNSGQALDSEEKRRGPMNSKGLAQLAYEKGMYILTAAQSYQAAWEASRLGHGYLTYALIEEGLKQGTADREPKDNQIVLREWLDYATERVPQMQEDKLKETPQKKDRRGKRELEFVFIEGDETIKDPTKRSVQRPRVFYRRELESLPMIVARPNTVSPIK